jgi:hypothetical protein
MTGNRFVAGFWRFVDRVGPWCGLVLSIVAVGVYAMLMGPIFARTVGRLWEAVEPMGLVWVAVALLLCMISGAYAIRRGTNMDTSQEAKP